MSFDDISSDYAEINSDSENCENFEIDRSDVCLGDILGAGQFGDVFRGTFRDKDGTVKDVAIKTCKLLREEELAGKLMDEAGVMEQFDHRNIIRIYGVCSSAPVWIVMEYAAFGEVRNFLKENTDRIHMDQLILYCYQLSTALHYLENKHFVHRDIAARNVLVSSWSCVKLADFGLSRWVSEDNYYKASKAVKLPIKWMAPESINFRRFTTFSDVWMFGVCMWEILTYGEKPFTGVNNNEVVDLLESGTRLPQPSKDSATCPLSIYHVMCECWHLKPEKRPRFAKIEADIREILIREKRIDDPENVCIAFKQTRKARDSSFGSVEYPPEKPVRPLCRKHSGLIGGSIPELDEARRLLNPNPNRSIMWKSDNNLDELENHRSTNYSKYSSPYKDTKLDPNNPMRIFGSTTAVIDSKTKQEEEETRKKESEWEERLKGITLDRSEDRVYTATVDIVKAITEMTQTVNSSSSSSSENSSSNCSQHLSQLYAGLTMNIGIKLKSLITAVDKVLEQLPTDSKNQVVMATNVLNSDMAALIRQVKLAQQYSNTLLNRDYQRTMLQAGHALAFDTRNLLETVDKERKKQVYLQTQKQSTQ